MKNIRSLLIICTLVTSLVQAQHSESSSVDHQRNVFSRIQLGLQFGQVQNDFGIGLNLTTPHFFHQHVSVRLSGNLQWLQYISSADSETTWSSYGIYKLGINGMGGLITKSIFVYGEGGMVVVTPNKNFSGKSAINGGYGLFGVQFLGNKGFSYYIELGGMGTGAVAEKSLFKTIYTNGFTTSVGIRKSL